MKRKGIISIIMVLVLVLHMGVVTEAANPVHLLISKEKGQFTLSFD